MIEEFNDVGDGERAEATAVLEAVVAAAAAATSASRLVIKVSAWQQRLDLVGKDATQLLHCCYCR